MRDLTPKETRAVGGGFVALSGADRRWLVFRPARAAEARTLSERAQ